MKKLILKSLLFISIIIGIHLILITHSYYMIKKQSIKIDTNNIIIGDSNTRNGINDKVYQDFKNFSQGGESYVFAYTKLNLILKENKIDTLILAHAPHNIINNKWINGNEIGNLKYRMTSYFPYYSSEIHKELILGNPISYITSWKNIWKTWNELLFSKSKITDIEFLGSYMRNTKVQNESNYTSYEYENPKYTYIEIKYLNKIIKLCNKNNIKLIFLATPKNFKRKDFDFYDKPEFYKYYKKHYHNIDFLNFQRLPMPKDSYADISHLSGIGSDYFSDFLAKHKIKDLLKNPKFNERLKP